MPVKTWVGRFAIVDGQPREDGPFLQSFPRQRPDEEEDELYVLVEPASPASKDYCSQLVDAIGRMFREDTLSMTGAVLRALDAAHQQLRDWNERRVAEHRVGAGVSCVAIRGRTAYLAQVGPAVAYHLGDGRVTRVVPELQATEPLGQPAQIEPLFTRYELSPGDLLLIASPTIEELLDQDALRSILLKGGDEALVELFRLARERQEFSLALLACVVEPEKVAVPTPREAIEEPTSDKDAPEQSIADPEPGSGLGPAQAVEQPVGISDGDEPAAHAERMVTAVAEDEPAQPAGLTQPKIRLKGQESDVRYRRATGLSGRIAQIPPIAYVLVGLLVVVGLIAVFVIPSALQESRDDQYADSFDAGITALTAALATSDPAERRELLATAELALTDAEKARPGTAEVANRLDQVAAAERELDSVVELSGLELVTDVSEQIPGPVSSKSLALGGGGAYFLDPAQERVIAVALVTADAEPFVLFAAGDLVGAEITGVPQHIAWAEELNALLIMDDARRLIAVTPPGQPGRLLSVRGSEAWGSADGIADAGGSLYVLDRLGDQVWRYPPSESGFDSEREPLLASVELEQALELALGDVLYLIIGNDTIMRVQNGLAEPLTLAGIDQPLSAPGSLVPLPAAGLLLVADRGNDRIVVLSTDGTFRQQWRSPTFIDLRSIAVDEVNGLLYVLLGGALYRTPLPQLP